MFADVCRCLQRCLQMLAAVHISIISVIPRKIPSSHFFPFFFFSSIISVIPRKIPSSHFFSVPDVDDLDSMSSSMKGLDRCHSLSNCS